ncbi:MAG: PIN domain-containing protein [Candidatus Woesearchaeota archaeon]
MLGYYLDTSIWLDYYEKRGKNGEIALRLISKLLKENLMIGYSDLTIMELKNLEYSEFEIKEILKTLSPKNSRRFHISRNQLEEANKIAKLRKIPRKDALHAILCRDHYFQLVATDKHFEKISDVATPARPESI